MWGTSAIGITRLKQQGWWLLDQPNNNTTGAGSPRMDGLVGQDGGGFAHEDGLVGQDGGGFAQDGRPGWPRRGRVRP